MIRDIFTYFIGTHRVSVPDNYKAKAVQLMYKHELSCNHAKLTNNGDYIFSVTHFTFGKLTDLFNKNDIKYTYSEIKGFPKILRFIKKRPGIIIGCLFFLTFMVMTSRTICSIQVSGNSTVTDEEIINLLEELGCGYGDYIPDIDFDMLHARFIAKSENISWIAVNMKGNHANVEVLEVKQGVKNKKENGIYANIVAKEEAQIAIIKTASGVPTVAEGDTVKKGELLISGVIGVREDRIRYEYAEGEVLAYVPRVIEIKIPFKNNEKNYTGNVSEEKSLKILKKSINLSLKGGIKYTIYDKIIDNRQVMLLGIYPLPIWYETVTFKEYDYVTKTTSQEKVVSSAMTELRYELDETLETAELISNKITTDITDDFVTIRYEMICLTDIAEICEFNVD